MERMALICTVQQGSSKNSPPQKDAAPARKEEGRGWLRTALPISPMLRQPAEKEGWALAAHGPPHFSHAAPARGKGRLGLGCARPSPFLPCCASSHGSRPCFSHAAPARMGALALYGPPLAAAKTKQKQSDCTILTESDTIFRVAQQRISSCPAFGGNPFVRHRKRICRSVAGGSLFSLLVLLQLLFSCVSTRQRQLAERYYNIATDYYNSPDYKQAVSYYELALKEDPNLKIVYLNYGLALIEIGNYQEAEQQLVRAYAVDARNSVCLSALGYLNFRAEKYLVAADWYRKSVEINKYNPETFYNLGIVEQYAGNYLASQQAFDKIPELQAPDEWPTELRRFTALNALHLGDEENAMALYGEYFAERGKDQQVFEDVYRFYSENAQYDKIPETFQIFEESLSNNPLASFLLAELYYLKLNNATLGREKLKEAVTRRFRDQERQAELVGQLRGSERAAAQKILDDAD